MGKPCPKHTAELKRRAVQLHNGRGTTYAEVAREIGVLSLIHISEPTRR